jgi:hypothetical protein
LTTKNANAQAFIDNIGTAPDGAVTFTAGAITVGFDGTKHGYITELAAADPATNTISYVTAADDGAGKMSYPTCANADTSAGTVKVICDATTR